MNNTEKIYFYHDFKKISLVVWKRIIQDVLSYHMIVSDLKWVEQMQDTYKELKLYIDKNGILPNEAKEEALIDTIKMLKDQINQIKDLNANTSISKEKLEALNKELLWNEKEYEFYLRYIKYNRFVYKQKKQGPQFFNKRKTALVIQEKMLLNLLDEISFSKKRAAKKIIQLKSRISAQVGFSSFDLESLYKYINPYIDDILKSDDFAYDFLQKNLFLDY